MSESLKMIDNFRHQVLRDLLSQCTEEQINVFNKMYGSINSIAKEKIDWAIQQCERSISGNKKRDLK